MKTEPLESKSPVHFIGDNLALDFINTAYGVGDSRCDHLDTDASVVSWLRHAGVLPTGYTTVGPKGLLAAAIELRSAARQIVEKRKAGKWADPLVLNNILALGSRHLEVNWKRGDEPSIAFQQTSKHVATLLVPIAEALASLLVEADFGTVRKCECDECTLLFHDCTKSHRRRWCSMALCGNRMKVAAYRARQKV